MVNKGHDLTNALTKDRTLFNFRSRAKEVNSLADKCKKSKEESNEATGKQRGNQAAKQLTKQLTKQSVKHLVNTPKPLVTRLSLSE